MITLAHVTGEIESRERKRDSTLASERVFRETTTAAASAAAHTSFDGQLVSLQLVRIRKQQLSLPLLHMNRFRL